MSEEKSLGRALSVLNRLTNAYLADAMADLGLGGAGQVRVALALANLEEGITQEELSRQLGVDKATVSRTIRPLLESGAVERRVSPADGRAYLLRLSAAMGEKVPEIEKRAYRWTKILARGLSAGELDALFRALETLTRNARSHLDNR